MVARSLLGPLSRQDPPRDLAVVERERVGTHDLIGLVTLPGDDDRIARLGPGEHRGNRAPAVRLGREAARDRASPAHANHDLVDDRLRLLRSRIVGGHPHLVAETGRDLTHDRPLPAIPIAAAAENDREPPAPSPNVSTSTASPCTIDVPAGSSALTTAVRRSFGDSASSSNSRRLAIRYRSSVPWKSRWSCVRFVNTATSNASPSARASASACEDTSIATPRTPRSRMCASIACRSSASGVVWLAGRVSSPSTYWIVPITPVARPCARSSASIRYEVVVLPLVPVMPTSASWRDGWP